MTPTIYPYLSGSKRRDDSGLLMTWDDAENKMKDGPKRERGAGGRVCGREWGGRIQFDFVHVRQRETSVSSYH